jgi:hypothetical protein
LAKKLARSRVPAGTQGSLIDRWVEDIGQLPRLVRAILAAITATAITVLIGLLIYSIADRVDAPEILQLAPVLLISLAGAGLALYWVGWRVLIGFDFEEAPLKPTLAALIWAVLGLVLLVIEIGVAIVFFMQSLS